MRSRVLLSEITHDNDESVRVIDAIVSILRKQKPVTKGMLSSLLGDKYFVMHNKSIETSIFDETGEKMKLFAYCQRYSSLIRSKTTASNVSYYLINNEVETNNRRVTCMQHISYFNLRNCG